MGQKSRHTTLERLCGYLWQDRRNVAEALLLAALANGMALMGPYLMGKAVDGMRGRGQVDFPRIFFYCGLMLAMYLASALLSYLLSASIIRISKKLTVRLRKEAFDRLMRIPIPYIDGRETGDLLSCLFYDINTIHDTLATDIVTMLTSLFTVTISFGMMAMISGKLVLVFVVSIPLSVIVTRWITDRSRKMYRQRSLKLGELNSYAEEHISGMRTIQAYGQQKNAGKAFGNLNREGTESCVRAQYYALLSGPSVNFINNSSLAAISAIGALLYLTGEMSLGAISSFVLYSRKFAGPISEIANNFSDLQAALAAAERVFSLLDEPEEQEIWDKIGTIREDQNTGKRKEKDSEKAARNGIQFSGVSFSYPDSSPILRGISFEAKPDTVTAIVGPTGSGKTTLLNLLMGFYPCDTGELCIQGVNIRQLPLSKLRCLCDMILQDSWIFSGTIYENIVYGRAEVTEQEVYKAVEESQLYAFIHSQPDGLQARIGEEGIRLSKGQRQMLAIARAMLSDAPILIFDEATSDVDIRTERQIQEGLNHLAKGRTCIMVAHRLSTIKNAGQILVLQNGCIVQRGTHTGLIQEDGLYRQIYQAQFSGGYQKN